MNNSASSDAFASPELFTRLSASVRIEIAASIGNAMRGELDAALAGLHGKNSGQSRVDDVGRGLCRAYLLYLDRQSQKALSTIDEAVLPNIYDLPEGIRMIVEQNRVEVTFGAGFPSEDDVERHYGQVDRRKLLGVKFHDSDALLEAAQASAEGKGYDSLPVYSTMLFDAYRHFNWRRIRDSAADLCREELRMHRPTEAVFYAILSEEKSSAQAVADYLRMTNDRSVLAAAMAKLAEVSHLSRHLTVACEFLSRLGDAIPSDCVCIWIDRLAVARRLPGSNAVERWISDPAWSATTGLLLGGKAREADGIIDEVLCHPRWSGNDIARHEFYEPLNAAANIATIDRCKKLVDAVMPCVTTPSPGHDFASAVKLLIAITERFPKLKAQIARNIYGDRKTIPHLLMVVAPAFDEVLHFKSPEELVGASIEHLRLQVERLESGAIPRTGYGEFMTHTTSGPTGAIAVKIGSCSDELQAVTTCRKNLPAPLLAKLIQVIIETIRDPENANLNRTMLFHVLRQVTDTADADTAARMMGVSAEFASDHRAADSPLYGQDEDHARLNPYRMSNGWPQDVRGAALLTVSEISRHHPSLATSRLTNLLAGAMGDANATLRGHGYHAVAVAGSAAADCLSMVIAGTRDVDPKAANTALQVAGMEAERVAAEGLVSPVLGIVEIQSRHSDVGVRFATATVVRQLQHAMAQGGGPELQRLDSVAERLKCDVSRRVRDAILGGADLASN